MSGGMPSGRIARGRRHVVVVATVLVERPDQQRLDHAGPCIAALMIPAANCSPTRMSCGSSSDWWPKFGSTNGERRELARGRVGDEVARALHEVVRVASVATDGMIATDGQVLVVVAPRDVVRVEPFEDRAVGRRRREQRLVARADDAGRGARDRGTAGWDTSARAPSRRSGRKPGTSRRARNRTGCRCCPSSPSRPGRSPSRSRRCARC